VFFPIKLKQALVLPLLKKNNLDSETASSYRPVSNLPYISKVIERVVARRSPRTCPITVSYQLDSPPTARSTLPKRLRCQYTTTWYVPSTTVKFRCSCYLIWAPRLTPSTIRFYFQYYLTALPWQTTHSPGLPHTLPTAHSSSCTLGVAHLVSQWIAASHKDQFWDPWSSLLIRKILSSWRMNTIHCHTCMLMTHNCTPVVDLKIATSSEYVFRTASLMSHCGAPLVVFSWTLKRLKQFGLGCTKTCRNWQATIIPCALGRIQSSHQPLFVILEYISMPNSQWNSMCQRLRLRVSTICVDYARFSVA